MSLTINMWEGWVSEVHDGSNSTNNRSNDNNNSDNGYNNDDNYNNNNDPQFGMGGGGGGFMGGFMYGLRAGLGNPYHFHSIQRDSSCSPNSSCSVNSYIEFIHSHMEFRLTWVIHIIVAELMYRIHTHHT